jgi:hypothetical protein
LNSIFFVETFFFTVQLGKEWGWGWIVAGQNPQRNGSPSQRSKEQQGRSLWRISQEIWKGKKTELFTI